MHRLSVTEARRLAVSAQRLDATAPATDLVDLVEHLTALPIDMTAAICPSPHLVAWGRLGSSYSPGDLSDALAERVLFEDLHGIRPMSDLPLYAARWALSPEYADARDWLEANDLFRGEVLDELADADEPLEAKQIRASAQVPWRSSGWNEGRSVTLMLEILLRRGEVALDGRRGNRRLWAPAERVLPRVHPADPAQAAAILDRRRLTALGIARPRGTVIPGDPIHVAAGEPATVEGVEGEWRVDPALLDRPFEGRTVLLSPFDAIVRDRARMTDLWGFEYALEMYKPAAKRRWGYFALPVLHHADLVGKVDATADAKAGRLFVDAVHEDAPWRAATRRAVDEQIEALATWLGLRPERG